MLVRPNLLAIPKFGPRIRLPDCPSFTLNSPRVPLRMCAHRSLQPTHFKPHLICVSFCTAMTKPRVTTASFVAPPKLRSRLPPQKTPQWDWLTPLSLPSPKTTSSTVIQRGTSQGANHFRHRRTLTEDTPNPRGRFYSISGLQCRRSTLASLASPSPIRRSQRPPDFFPLIPGKSPLLFLPIPKALGYPTIELTRNLSDSYTIWGSLERRIILRIRSSGRHQIRISRSVFLRMKRRPASPSSR